MFWRALTGALVGAVIITSTAGCGSAASEAHRSRSASPSPDGLRAVAGYGAYGSCDQGCMGHVPASLRRPLHLPRAGTGCPVTRSHPVGGDFPTAIGTGPVYAGVVERHGQVLFPWPTPPPGSPAEFAGSRWSGFKVLWVSRPTYAGPVLIRGRRLDGPQAIGFQQGQVPLAELQRAPGQGAAAAPSPQGWRNWPSTTRIRAPGCYGWQIDGTHFSEVIVIKAVPHRSV